MAEPKVGDAPKTEDVVVVLKAETTLVVSVRDQVGGAISDIQVTLTPPAGIAVIGDKTGKSDTTGRVEFKLAAPGDVTISVPATAPFEATSRSVTLVDKSTSMVAILLETKFELKHRYLWQNAALRPTIYPVREEYLRKFLQTYKDIDLHDPTKIPPDAKDKVDALRLAKEAQLAKAKEDEKAAADAKNWKARDEAKARQAQLEGEIKSLKGTDAPKVATRIAYVERLAGMKHKALVSEVLARFDADSDGEHEKWARYMVLHYTGMRYASAHSSFADSKRLLPLLVGEELLGWLSDTAKATTSRLLELAREARAKVKKDPKSYEPTWDEKQKGKNPNPDTLADMSEADLDDAKNTKKREDLRKRVAFFFEMTARKLTEPLTDAQVLGILQSRAPTTPIVGRRMPANPWRAVASCSALRNDAAGIGDIFANDKESNAYLVASSADGYERATKAWMRQDVTQWRTYHAKVLEPITTRAVCNEIDEMSLHARELSPPGGITENAKWTAKSSATGQLKPLASLKDAEAHGSIFFSGWRTLNEEPGADKDANAWRQNTAAYFDVGTPIAGGYRLGPSDTIDPASEPPWQVVGLVAKHGTGVVELSWQAANGAGSYEIFASTAPVAGLGTLIGSATTTKFSHVGVSNGNTWYYTVRAKNTKGDGTPSRCVGLTLDGPTKPPTKLTRPSELVASTSMTGVVTLKWKGAPGGGGYQIFGALGAAPNVTLPPLNPALVSGTSFEHTPPAGELWHYLVVAMSKGVASDPSNLAIAEAGPVAARKWPKGIYTYHTRLFKPNEGPVHTELCRTYFGTAALDKNKEYAGTPDGRSEPTTPGQGGVLTDVLIWTHEAAIVRVDVDHILTFETAQKTGLNDYPASGRTGWNMYTNVAQGQKENTPKLDVFLDRKLAETKCDPDL